MRFTFPLARAALAATLTFVVAGTAFARDSRRPDQPVPVRSLRSIVNHYRTVTWNYQRAAHLKKTPTSYRERRTSDRVYLQWAIDTWTRRAYGARRAALAKIQHRLSVSLPKPPTLHARLAKRVTYSRRLTLSLRQIYPGTVTRRYAGAKAATGTQTLQLWQQRSALAAVAVSLHARAEQGLPAIPAPLNDAFLCIHHYEGAWNSNTGNGYYGGLQMDITFQSVYGAEFLNRWGTADKWPPWAQIQAAVRAYQSGRGFYPWPNTARACGLL